MIRRRIGSDLQITWTLEQNEGDTPFQDRDLTLYIRSGRIRKKMDITAAGFEVSFIFRGKDQRKCGFYDLELVENEGQIGMDTTEFLDAFEIYDPLKEEQIYEY